MKKLLTVFTFFLSCHFMSAQEFFVRNNNKDTIHGRNLEYTTNSQGFISEIKYQDQKGKVITLEGKKALKDVISLHYPTAIVERMPLKESKPDGYCRYGERKVNGKLKVLVYNDLYESTNWVRSPIDSRLDGFKTTTSGTYLFYLKLPDGTLLNANSSKVIKKVIKPYLLQCKEFEKQYKGDFSREEKKFIEMIKLYNYVCR